MKTGYLVNTRKLFCLHIKKRLKTMLKLQSQHANPKNLIKDWFAPHCITYPHCFSSFEKTLIHTIDIDVVILLIAYLSDILHKNSHFLANAKMEKSGIYHDMRSMILTLDHPTFVALPFLCMLCLRHSVQLLS